MRIAVVGATGTIGGAVADALEQKGHEVVRASRNSDPAIDIESPESIAKFYDLSEEFDGVVSCCGNGAWKKLTELEDSDLQFSIVNKQLGNINLVRHGLEKVKSGGFFILTTGIFSQKPMPGVSALAMVNGALESFVRGAALDMPRGIRINAVSPPFIKETAEQMGMEGGLPAAENATAYVELAEGKQNGEVIFPGE